ncbi:MAG: diaminopimelate decarboxylase [Candidatus Binatia bacterium]
MNDLEKRMHQPHPLTFPVTREGYRTEIAGLPVVELARRFGTPTFVYDAAVIAARVRSLSRFDVVRYAQKACPNIAVLDLCRREGALVDATSAGEVHRALAAGYRATGDPAPIVYTADIFDRDSLDLVVEQGVHVNCGSADMIDQYAARVGKGDVTLRINPGFGHGHSRKTNTGGEHSKHGIWHEDLPEVLGRAAGLGMRISGLHVHIGSGSDLEHLSQVCKALEKLALRVGPQLDSISAGGGLPVPYKLGDATMDVEAYFELWDATRRRLQETFGHPVRLEIEPGRYLVADSGFLVTEVRALKRMGDNRFCLVDAGFNNLVRPAMYGSWHPMALAPADGDLERALGGFVVGGPLCESGDIFTQEESGDVGQARLPSPRVGDFVVIGVAGAYGASMSSNYNSKPLAAEVLVVDRTAHLVRERQRLEDLTRGERVPPL